MDTQRLGVAGVRLRQPNVQYGVSVGDEDGHPRHAESGAVDDGEDLRVGEVDPLCDVRGETIVDCAVDAPLEARLVRVCVEVELGVGGRVELDETDVDAVRTDVESVDDGVDEVQHELPVAGTILPQSRRE